MEELKELKMKKWRIEGIRISTGEKEFINVNSISSINPNLTVTLDNGIQYKITQYEYYLITEGELWFENHKKELSSKEYDLYKNQYNLDIANHAR